jgi:hypothetical protein
MRPIPENPPVDYYFSHNGDDFYHSRPDERPSEYGEFLHDIEPSPLEHERLALFMVGKSIRRVKDRKHFVQM